MKLISTLCNAPEAAWVLSSDNARRRSAVDQSSWNPRKALSPPIGYPTQRGPKPAPLRTALRRMPPSSEVVTVGQLQIRAGSP